MNSFNPSPRTNLFGTACAIAACAALLAIPSVTASAQNTTKSFTVVETGRGYGTLQSAINAIGNRRGTISVAPGTYRQCAVQEAGVITYVSDEPGSAIFERKACEGKAALVLRGTGAEIRGLVFRGIHVSDGNGAGI
ncbi:MAG: right-handed parallel beta-helix repeat-containing protein, partial [Pseudomonadota bacterium]